ncbi:MAG TPA: CtsR family transcriptional regulator [Clostridiales bacterium]|nr:CtsR family transcriptional regulator [Clostridiales bacterium]
MGLSDRIEAFINELMRGDNDFAEFGRNELADIFGCVPSQINYVISTRFNPQKGYSVESRRGGGGYIRISRIDMGNAEEKIGSACSFKTAQTVINGLFAKGRISEQTAKAVLTAVSDKTLQKTDKKEELRAEILKNVIFNL